MVVDPGDCRWSGYAAHGLGSNISIHTPCPLYLSPGETQSARLTSYGGFIGERLGADVIAKVRHCANKGLILGTDKFRQQFMEIAGGRAE
jgi:putative transposase